MHHAHSCCTWEFWLILGIFPVFMRLRRRGRKIYDRAAASHHNMSKAAVQNKAPGDQTPSAGTSCLCVFFTKTVKDWTLSVVWPWTITLIFLWCWASGSSPIVSRKLGNSSFYYFSHFEHVHLSPLSVHVSSQVAPSSTWAHLSAAGLDRWAQYTQYCNVVQEGKYWQCLSVSVYHSGTYTYYLQPGVGNKAYGASRQMRFLPVPVSLMINCINRMENGPWGTVVKVLWSRTVCLPPPHLPRYTGVLHFYCPSLWQPPTEIPWL